MNHKQFSKILQQRIASAAVTPSAARKMGPKGTVRAAREFLSKVDLKHVGSSGKNYTRLLDNLTLRLVRALPEGAKHWGAARKFLNIFLRDATYNVHLRKTYRLGRIEGALEVPLDSHVAKELIRVTRNLGPSKVSLPRWKTVISVDGQTNKEYQDAVKRIAKKERIHPVHFDVIAWRKSSNYL
jgi:hypothetical protein